MYRYWERPKHKRSPLAAVKKRKPQYFGYIVRHSLAVRRIDDESVSSHVAYEANFCSAGFAIFVACKVSIHTVDPVDQRPAFLTPPFCLFHPICLHTGNARINGVAPQIEV